MSRGTIHEFLEAAAGTASQVFGEPTQRVAHRGGTAVPEQRMHLPFGVGLGGQVGARRARPWSSRSSMLHGMPALEHRSARGH
jgi:hypothetical protein